MKRTLHLPVRHFEAVLSHAIRGAALTLALTGCALRSAEPEVPAAGVPSAALRGVTAELVGVFTRVAELDPDRVEVRLATREEPLLTTSLEAALMEAGYRFAPSESAVPVDYVLQSRPDGLTVTVAMGSVQTRRSYAGSLQAPVPDGPLYVRGTDASALERPSVNPEVEFAASARLPADASEMSSLGSGSNLPTVTAAPVPDPISRTPIALGESASGSPMFDGVVSRALRNADAPPTVRNVMQVGNSNFADLFTTYRTVTEEIMIFPNDSMRLGDANKAVVARAVERFQPETDMFAVVGCSLGPTKVVNGNEVLALGRANRVAEELVRAGVPSSRVVDEGCWAGEASARFPSRGVVLTLKREEAGATTGVAG